MTFLSLATIAWNEEQFIRGLLDSVSGVVDEVVIGIDSRTTDKTAEIVEQRGGRTFEFDWCEDFSVSRNLSLDYAKGEWVIVLDADERLTKSGAFVVRDLMKRVTSELSHVDGFMFGYCDVDLEGEPQRISRSSVRMFRRIPEIRYRGTVHEEPFYVAESGDVTWFDVQGVAAIVHLGHDPRIMEARGKYDRNVRLLEKRIAEHPEDEYAKHKLAQQLTGHVD